MQRSDWSRIAHGDLEFMGPYDETSFERLLDGAALPAGARVLDLGCGKGALLRWLGVARADRRHRRRSAPGNVGRSQEYGWWPATRGRFRPSPSRSTWSARWERSATSASWPRWPGPGGLVLLGDGYWRQTPGDVYLAALGATIDDMLDWQATLAIGAPHGLTLVRALPSSVEQWDRLRGDLGRERRAVRGPSIQASRAWRSSWAGSETAGGATRSWAAATRSGSRCCCSGRTRHP